MTPKRLDRRDFIRAGIGSAIAVSTLCAPDFPNPAPKAGLNYLLLKGDYGLQR